MHKNLQKCMRQCSAWLIYNAGAILPQGGRVSMSTVVISILHVFPVEVWHCVVVVIQILFSQFNGQRCKILNSVVWFLCPKLPEVCTLWQDGTEESLVHGLYRSNGRRMVVQLVSVLGTASGGLKLFTFTTSRKQQLNKRLPWSG